MAKKTSKSTNDPSKFARPYISSAANTLQSSFGANEANVANLSSGLNAALPGIQANALNNPALTAASGYDQDVLAGKYLNGNPQLEAIIRQTNDSVGDTVNGKIGLAGGAGGSAQTQLLARELAKNETALRYGDYSSERDRMGTAATNAGALTSAQNGGLAAYLAAVSQAATLPTTNATGLAQGVGGLLGNYTTKTTQASSFDNLLNLIAAGSSAAKAAQGGG